MTVLKYILLSFLWTNTIAQVAATHPQNHNTTFAKSNSDTSHFYFPLKQEGQSTKDNSLDHFMDVWYSGMLAAMKEPILINYKGDIETYRFTWLRTFSKPIAIRIQKKNDSVFLTTKVLSGAGGYDPGQIITDSTIVLTMDNWNQVQTKVDRIHFWTLPTQIEYRGNDGAEWILEGYSPLDGYHFITRWTETKGSDYRNLCLHLLSLSGIKIPDREIY